MLQGVLFLIALALFLATLPGTVELALLTFPAFLPGRRPPPAPDAAAAPRLAVVIPAHNDAAGLPETVRSLLGCHHPLPPEDLHVVADNCTDDTAAVARSFGCSVLERRDEVRRGKGYALHYAFEHLLARDDYDAFIVVDADTSVEQNFLDAFRALFAGGARAGQAAYRVKNAQANLRTRLMNIAFLAFNYLRPLARERLGLSVGILGNGFALHRDTLARVPYDSFSIVEDLEYHPRLIRAGVRVRFLPHTAVWSDMPETGREAATQRERWEGGRFRMIREQVPGLLRDALFGPQPRLLEPALELLLLPLTYHVLLLVALLFVAGGWLPAYAGAALGLVVVHVLAAMWLGGAGWRDWQALLSAPFYMLWKLMNFSRILRAARRGVAWKRTSRKDS